MKILLVISLLVLAGSAHVLHKRAFVPQSPQVWDALKDLRGGKDLTVVEIMDLYIHAVPGKDFPINAVIPDTPVDCTAYKQDGFYADDSAPSNCQIFHRCNDGVAKSFLCPNETLFNQITLICDWFYNIDCPVSKKYQDYSNSRLGDSNAPLLDTQLVYQITGAVTGAETERLVTHKPKPVKNTVTKKTGKAKTIPKKGRSADSDSEPTQAPLGGGEPAPTVAGPEVVPAETTAAAATEAPITPTEAPAETTAAAENEAPTTPAGTTAAAANEAPTTPAGTTAAAANEAPTTPTEAPAGTTAAAANEASTTPTEAPAGTTAAAANEAPAGTTAAGTTEASAETPAGTTAAPTPQTSPAPTETLSVTTASS